MGSGRYSWGRPIVLLSPCGWAGGMTTKKKSKESSIVFKYANRRLECFYFKRARWAAIWKPGKGNDRKPRNAKISPERIEFISADRPRRVLAKLRPGLRIRIRLTFKLDPGTNSQPVTLRQVKGGKRVRYTARRVGRTNVFQTDVIELVERVSP